MIIPGVMAQRRSAPSAAVPTDGLIAWYTMQNISGSTLIDEMGNYNGTVSGTTLVAGKFGNAMAFNGTASDGVLLPSMGVAQITISLWVWIDSLAPLQQPIIGNWNTGATTSYIIDIWARNFRWITEQPPTHIITTPAVAGQWVHVCVYNRAAGLGGIVVDDGVAVEATSANTLRTPSGALTVGYKGDDGSPRFGGRIDQLRIYNRTLTRAEITQLYNEAA